MKILINSRAERPSDKVISYYYKTKTYKKWGNWKGTEEEIKNHIKDFLYDNMKKKMVTDYCLSERKNHPVEIYLKEPPLPLTNIVIGSSPASGPEDAPITVIEFSDYLCPSCQKAHETVKLIKEKYGDKIRLVFKDFPLEMHRGAGDMSIASACAGKQGKYWEYQDLLFSENNSPGLNDSLRFADELGLDQILFQQCISDEASDKRLENEIEEARQAGITMTPTYVINGRLHAGSMSFDKFCKMIDEALEESGK